MNQDTKNLTLAFALSLAVIVGWNYFYGVPQVDKTRQQFNQQQVDAAAPQAADHPKAAPRLPAAAPVRPRAEILAGNPRVIIDTKRVSGSIDLKSGRINDLALKDYHETIDKKSPNIVLLSPSGTADPYYAELGFVGEPGAKLALPNVETLWTADTKTLTTEKPVVLSWDNGQGLTFKRTISVDDQYMFSVKDSVENKTGAAINLFPYALVSRHGKPKTDGYAVLHEGFVGVVGTSGIQEMGYDAIVKETKSSKTFKGTGGWIGFTDKYWAATVIPDQSKAFEGRFSASDGPSGKIYQADYLGEALAIAPGATGDVTTRLFAGAKESHLLDKYQKEQGISKFELLIDWGWFYFITKPMFYLLDMIYKFTGNFGVAILLITVIVKAAFFPLANKSYMSMAKMKNVQPQMTAIRERFADDKVKQQQEMMELYKREKINPVAGCLPIAIQIPVFFALYKVLFVTIEMRQAPFFGWIKDLSAPDPTNVFNLFGLLPFDPTHIPLFGSFLAIGIWPLIMGISMFVQMKMNPEPTDPVQKTMFAWMPVIFTFMLGTFPSGLVIYWTWNNLLSVLQQGMIMKKAGTKIELFDNLKSMFAKKAAN
ncbi:MAG: membrane protein insertase YidC [Phyllobacteriaceae bacterium]|nr:membrane protein insertase YidC [Phyllobacteriaceae bacterium]